MENASKALLMAGGMLIALIIISALLLMFNQLGVFQDAQSDSEKASQLAEFNFDFERYADDEGITGTDLISLANKIVDYNEKANKGGYSKYIDYDIKMSLTVTNMNAFISKYGYSTSRDALFKEPTYVISNEQNTNTLKEALNTYNNADSELLKKLSAIYDKYDNDIERKANIRSKLIELKGNSYSNWDGRSNGISPTLIEIKNYKEYTEFKTSKFVASRDPEYQNGQIKTLYFKFVE